MLEGVDSSSVGRLIVITGGLILKKDDFRRVLSGMGGGTGEDDADDALLVVVEAPRGCQPGGQSGLQRADAIVGQVDDGDVAVS